MKEQQVLKDILILRYSLFQSKKKTDWNNLLKSLRLWIRMVKIFKLSQMGKIWFFFQGLNSAAQKNGAPQKIIYMSYRGKSQQPGIYVLDLLSKYQYLVKNIGGVSFSPRFTTSGNGALMSVADGKSTNRYHLNLLKRRDKKTYTLYRLYKYLAFLFP